MIAPRELPEAFARWNRKHRAPFGPDWWVGLLGSRHLGMFARRYGPGWLAWKYRTQLPSRIIRSIGPFGFQLNSASRRFEYPWAFFATPLGERGIKAVDLGAGASGFQFVLASAGVEVTSVDPLINPSESVDWRFSEEDFHRLNLAFGGKVRFVRDFLETAHLAAGSCDRVYAISVLEHIPQAPATRLMQEISRILKPGGYFVATVDLFLDCYPFTSRASNAYGTNVSVKGLVQASNLQLTIGEPSELYGFDEFSAEAVTTRWERYLVVGRLMTQCVVLRKPGGT